MGDNIVCLAILETGERKKLTLSTGDYQEVVAALSAFTTVTDSTLIQVYDDILEDFIDLERGATVPHKGKVKVARKCVPQLDDCASPVEQYTDAAATMSSVCIIQDSSVPSTSTVTAIHECVALQDPNDYLKFTLPTFGMYEEVLKRGMPISGRIRRSIIDKIFQACVTIAWLPSKLLYRTAIEKLLTKYPHLRDSIENQSGMESWVLALRAKFKNMRKKTEHVSEEMQALKRKSLHTGVKEARTDVPNKKLCRLFDCSHLVAYGETEESIKRHQEWLLSNSACEDEQSLRPRLLATAQERHKCLRSMTLTEATVAYPFLKTEASLLTEFDLVFKRNITKSIQDACDTMGTVILNYGTATEVAVFSEVATERPVLGVLEFVAGRCNESLAAILASEEPYLTPCLMARPDGNLTLYVDGEELLTVNALLAGIACLFAAFWVFHIEYPKKAFRLLTFIEHAFLGLSQTKPRVKALELINFFKAHAN